MAIAFDSSGSHVATASPSTIDITTAATGAWCYAWWTSRNGSSQTPTTPSGWTLVGAVNHEGTTSTQALYKRKKIAGDTTFSLTFTTSDHATLVWASYTGVDDTTPDDGAGSYLQHAASSTNYTSPTVSNTFTNGWAVSFHSAASTTAARTMTKDAAMTQRQNVNNASNIWAGPTMVSDSNGIVTVASHSYIATIDVAEGHGGCGLIYLNPTSAPATHPVRKNTADGGTNGSSVTTGNTTSGDAWSTVTIGTSATVQWDNTHNIHGPLGIKFQTAATSAIASTSWTGLSFGTSFYFRASMFFPATPTVNSGIIRGYTAAAAKFRVYVSTGGVVVMQDSSGSNIATFTSVLTAQPYRLEGRFDVGATGVYDMRLYVGDSTVALETKSGTSNFGTTAFDQVDWGNALGNTNLPAYWLDDFAIDDTAFLGPVNYGLESVSTNQSIVRSYNW